MPALWTALSTWLGTPLTGTHHNRTPVRQVPGLLRRPGDIATAVELLRDRTQSDAIVWRHFADAAGIERPDALADELVERRLQQLCSTSFLAAFSAGRGSITAPTGIGAAIDGLVAPGARLLTVDLPAVDLPPGGERSVTHVSPVALPAPTHVAAGTVVTLADRDLVDLRDTLVGRDFDDIVVGPQWLTRLRAGTLFDQLRQIADSDTRLLVVCPSDAAAATAEAHLRTTGWQDVSFVPLSQGTLAVACPADLGAHAATHYGLPIRLDDPGDSRAVVLRLCDGAPTVLELGSSEGLMTRVMVQRGQRVTAVEFNPAAAASVAQYAEHVVEADLDRPDSLAVLEGRRFHTVLAADVLEHLRDPEACLRRALTLLEPGGTVILSIPNLAHADVRMSLLDGRVPYADLGLLDRTHIRWFTYNGVQSLLAACELVVVGWHRTERAPGTADVPLAPDLAPIARHWFHDDPEATTFQWVLQCRRADEAAAVADPQPPTRPRRFVHQPSEMGIKASGSALSMALRRRLWRELHR
jgi:2-polyprenyl-3-methyl-5-hydroxy-6-metoxy-1,4-benzoquinol methylase